VTGGGGEGRMWTLSSIGSHFLYLVFVELYCTPVLLLEESSLELLVDSMSTDSLGDLSLFLKLYICSCKNKPRYDLEPKEY
jgi:hypothetical protein